MKIKIIGSLFILDSKIWLCESFGLLFTKTFIYFFLCQNTLSNANECTFYIFDLLILVHPGKMRHVSSIKNTNYMPFDSYLNS